MAGPNELLEQILAVLTRQLEHSDESRSEIEQGENEKALPERKGADPRDHPGDSDYRNHFDYRLLARQPADRLPLPPDPFAGRGDLSPGRQLPTPEAKAQQELQQAQTQQQGQGLKKPAGLWDATQNLGFALGGDFGQLAASMRKLDNVSQALGQLGESLFGRAAPKLPEVTLPAGTNYGSLLPYQHERRETSPPLPVSPAPPVPPQLLPGGLSSPTGAALLPPPVPYPLAPEQGPEPPPLPRTLPPPVPYQLAPEGRSRPPEPPPLPPATLPPLPPLHTLPGPGVATTPAAPPTVEREPPRPTVLAAPSPEPQHREAPRTQSAPQEAPKAQFPQASPAPIPVALPAAVQPTPAPAEKPPLALPLPPPAAVPAPDPRNWINPHVRDEATGMPSVGEMMERLRHPQQSGQMEVFWERPDASVPVPAATPASLPRPVPATLPTPTAPQPVPAPLPDYLSRENLQATAQLGGVEGARAQQALNRPTLPAPAAPEAKVSHLPGAQRLGPSGEEKGAPGAASQGEGLEVVRALRDVAEKLGRAAEKLEKAAESTGKGSSEVEGGENEKSGSWWTHGTPPAVEGSPFERRAEQIGDAKSPSREKPGGGSMTDLMEGLIGNMIRRGR